MNRAERLARRFDRWQQRHPPMAFAVAVMKKFGDDQAGNQVALLTYFAFVATFPLLLALTTILGVALRKNPELQRDLVNSAFAEFPIIGAQIHDQLGVATFWLLAWLGLQATVVVLAVEADAVRARHLWPRSLVPPPLTDADKAYYTDAVRAETQRPELRLVIQFVTPNTTTERHDAG